MKVSSLMAGTILGLSVFGMTGCATKTFVREQVTGVQTQVDANRAEIARLNQVTAAQDKRLNQLSDGVKEALQRAEEAGKLAKGKFVCEVVLSEEAAHFAFNKSDLSSEAKGKLDALAQRLKSENRNVYIEIQGHTDAVGSDDYNERLGMARARAVRYYLYTQAGIALHRMNTFSYGEAKPVAENDTPENRAKNRRVTIVVME